MKKLSVSKSSVCSIELLYTLPFAGNFLYVTVFVLDAGFGESQGSSRAASSSGNAKTHFSVEIESGTQCSLLDSVTHFDISFSTKTRMI